MVKNKLYIPDRGDIVWINLNPQKGHEQSGKRPAIVLSPKEYNKKTNLFLVCPITSHIKKYPFEVVVNEEKIKGVVLSDQMRSMDWKVRKACFIQKISQITIQEIQEKILALIVSDGDYAKKRGI